MTITSFMQVAVILLWACIIFFSLKNKSKKGERTRQGRGRSAPSDIFLQDPPPEDPFPAKPGRAALPKDQDITCETLYGHQHENAGRMYIVQEQPETGYVILNGKKRRLKDLKDY